jgi:hypothetical protein
MMGKACVALKCNFDLAYKSSVCLEQETILRDETSPDNKYMKRST